MQAKRSHDSGLSMAIVSLACAILFWSGVPLALRYFARQLDAWTVNGMRYLFAALFWMPFLIRNVKSVPPGRSIWRDAAMPALVHLVGQVMYGFTPYYNDATVINFVGRSSFLFTTVFGFILLYEERPLLRRPGFWIALLSGLMGLSIMFTGGLGTASTSAFGMSLLIITSAFWGIYSVFVRKFMHGYSFRLSFAVISIYAAPVLIGLMLTFGDWRDLRTLDFPQWALVWLSAVTGIAVGHVLFFRAIHRLGAITSEGSLLLIPFVTAVLAFWVLGEQLTWTQWNGGLILVLGSLLLIVVRARTPIRRPPITTTTD